MVISVAYLKHVYILENAVNLCMINDLYYLLASNQNAIFYYPTHPTRGSFTAPADITAIRASLIDRYIQMDVAINLWW